MMETIGNLGGLQHENKKTILRKFGFQSEDWGFVAENSSFWLSTWHKHQSVHAKIANGEEQVKSDVKNWTLILWTFSYRLQRVCKTCIPSGFHVIRKQVFANDITNKDVLTLIIPIDSLHLKNISRNTPFNISGLISKFENGFIRFLQ